MTKGVIARDEAGVQGTLEYAAPLDAAWPRPERVLDLEFYVRFLFAGLMATLTSVLLSQDVHQPARLVVAATVITLIWVVALWKSAAVSRAHGFEPVVTAAVGAVAGLAAVSLLNVSLLHAVIQPSTVVVMSAGVFAMAASFRIVTSRRLAPRRRVAVVGTDEVVEDLIRELEESNSEFECLGVIADRNGDSNGSAARILGRTADLVDIVRRGRPELVVCSSPRVRTNTVGRLLDAGVTSVRVLDSLEFSELAFRRVTSRPIRPSWFAGVLDIEAKHYSARVKRVFDATFAAAALLLSLPLFLVIASLVRLSGPVFYRQVRSGEGGELFEMVKFRTMIPDAEQGVAVWAAENDPRVTRVGRFLRRSRLDELPQLWNVLRGEMSIVGPRPERPEYLEALRKEVPFWSRRHLLKPGITGWAQVHLAYTDDVSGAASKLSYDLYYLKHRSLALDFVILLKTFRVMLSGSGAR